MMSSSAASDAEHSNQSLDHLHLHHLRQRAADAGPDDDVKDLSIRGQPQQAPVITSTAPAYLHRRHHIDNSVDFDSSASRSSSVHLDGSDHSPSSPPPHHHHHHHDDDHIDVGGSGDNSITNAAAAAAAADAVDDQQLRTVRMRKISESACHHDNEHNNNYKFKNYIQQRFSQDTTTTHHDISAMTDCGHTKSPSPSGIVGGGTEPDLPMCKKTKLCNSFHDVSCDDKIGNGGGGGGGEPSSAFPSIFSKPGRIVQNNVHGAPLGGVPPNPVPIFALHSQGRYYVPLTVDFEAIVPYLSTGGAELLATEKMTTGGSTLPPLHAININVNFSSAARMKAMIGGGGGLTEAVMSSTKLKSDINGW